MTREFLDFIEDILEGMNKAEVLLEEALWSIAEGKNGKGLAE